LEKVITSLPETGDNYVDIFWSSN